MQQIPVNKYHLSFILLLVVPALFYNLGLIGIMADEPTRANVAMEMMYSGNYLVSKITDLYYYKKPPLFNWLLVAVYQITGSKSEFVTRLTAVIPLLCFALRLFFIVKKQLNFQTALLVAFISITYGRMLYYDSMLGHIDILYGWVTFESFYLLYRDYNKGKFFLLFLSFYALHAIGFMLKGLPSLAFPVLTLLAMGWHQQQYKWLFSIKHAAAALIAFAPVFLFFWLYSSQNSVWGWVEQLWDQSRQRTVLDKTLWESIRHLFTFPLDQFMHLAPWSLLTIFLFRNQAIKKIKQHPFLMYLFWVFILNILPYWASPGYYPRYLFMLYPIIFIFWGFAFFESYSNSSADFRWSNLTVKILTILIILGYIGAIIYMKIDLLEWRFFIVLLLLLICGIGLYINQQQSIWLFVAFLLITRIGFNLYVLPHRAINGSANIQKQQALDVIQSAAGKPLHLLTPNTGINHNYIYYFERERGQTLTIRGLDTVSLFIVHPAEIPSMKYQTLKTFTIDYEDWVLHLVKFNEYPKY